MDDIRDLTRFILFGGALLLAIFAAAFLLLIAPFTAWQCANYEDVTGIETRYVLPNGCYLNLEGRWVYYGEYRDRMVAEEGLKSR